VDFSAAKGGLTLDVDEEMAGCWLYIALPAA
jgi:hypothetical protein